MHWTWPATMDINELMAKLTVFGEHKGYAVERVGRTGDILEMKKGGNVRTASGLSTGIRLVITHKGESTVVEVSEHGKEFATKAAVGTVGLFLWGIPTAMAAYGAFSQKRLMEDVKKEIDDFYDNL